MRMRAWVLCAMPVGVGCALTFSYDDYEKEKLDATAGSSTGASGGINGDAQFGGTGGTGGVPGDGMAGADGNTGACGGANEGTFCDGPKCVGSYAIEAICKSGICQQTKNDECDPFVCENGSCLTACVNSQDCVNGFDCAPGPSICEPDCLNCHDKYASPQLNGAFCTGSDALWLALKNCCELTCDTPCSDASPSVLEVCHGTSTASPSGACGDCLNANCSTEYAACQADE
jgi:hypothetical protein